MGDAAVNLVRAIVSYIQQRSTTMTGPSLDRLISSQCQACVSHLRGSDLSHDDANQILGVLREERCLFNTEQVDTISAVLDEKLTYTTSASHQPRASSKPHQQTHNHLRNYLTEYMWQAIYSHASMTSKLEQCASFFIERLCLRNPSETTRRDMIAIILAATDQDCSGDESLGYVHTLKKMMGNARNLFPTGDRGPDQYPEAVDAFMRMYPTAYTPDDPPVQCKISELSFINKQTATLCRVTHGSASGASGGQLTSMRRQVGKRTVQSGDGLVKPEPDPDMRDQVLRYVLSGSGSTTTVDLPKYQAYMQHASGPRVEPKAEVKSEGGTDPSASGHTSRPGLLC